MTGHKVLRSGTRPILLKVMNKCYLHEQKMRFITVASEHQCFFYISLMVASYIFSGITVMGHIMQVSAYTDFIIDSV
jgi:hypothetical protein